MKNKFSKLKEEFFKKRVHSCKLYSVFCAEEICSYKNESDEIIGRVSYWKFNTYSNDIRVHTITKFLFKLSLEGWEKFFKFRKIARESHGKLMFTYKTFREVTKEEYKILKENGVL